jgi:hypothetical protein
VQARFCSGVAMSALAEPDMTSETNRPNAQAICAGDADARVPGELTLMIASS